jgi:hypothetical protein
MTVNWPLVVEALKAAAWPLVVGVGLWLFRRQLSEIILEVMRRTKKISVFEVSVELTPLPELRPTTWTATMPAAGPQDVRQLTPSDAFDSWSQPLFHELLAPAGADYAIVDLGCGHEWLTSRLFIFAVVLGEVRGLRAFVFLETTPGTRRRFLGVASPANVRRMLGHRYPWLEESLARALNDTYGPLRSDQKDQSAFSNASYPLSGDEALVSGLVRAFVGHLQRATDPPASERDSYLQLPTRHGDVGTPPDWERTRWISAEQLERDLSGCIDYEWVEESPDLPRTAVAESVVRRQGVLVALVDKNGRFRGLVDKVALLEQMATREVFGGKREFDRSHQRES